MFISPSSSRQYLIIGLAVAGVMSASCGDGEDGGGSQTGDRIRGGSLTVGTFEPSSLDPHFSSFAHDGSLQRMLWRGLYRLDPGATPRPMMALDEPEISEDGLTYTVTLKKGLSWSDGDDLTAQDFVAGILRTCNPVNAAPFQYLLSNVVGCDEHFGAGAYDAGLEEQIGVRAHDDQRLELRLEDAQPTFLHTLSLATSFPSPVHLLAESSDPWPVPAPDAPQKLVYNGPYVLTEYSPGDHATLAPNANWAGEIKPTLESLTLRFIDDLSTATNAYRTGELDFANVDVTQLSTSRERFGEGEEYFRAEKSGTLGVQMQLNHPVLGDPEVGLDVRLALGRAIDRDALNRACYEGAYQTTTTWIPESDGGEPPDAFVSSLGYDANESATNLADAGYSSRDDIQDLSILTAGVPEAVCFAEFVQNAWRESLGINVGIDEVDVATYSSRVAAGDFDLTLAGFIPDYPDPESWVLGFFPSDGSYNSHHCSMPAIDERVEQARFNQDDEERRRLYREINEIAVTNVCGVFVLFHFGSHYLIKPHVVGMRENLGPLDLAIAGDWLPEAWGRSE